MEAMTRKARGKRLSWLAAGALLWLVSPAHAQTNQGTDFWLAETDNLGCRGDFAIAIANPSGVSANVTIDNVLSGSTPGTIPSGSLSTFTFPCRTLQVTGIGVNMVYHVTSDVGVVVYIFNPLVNAFTNDASLLLPVDALGKNHRVGSYLNPAGNRVGSFLGVVAVESGMTNVQTFDRAGTLRDNVNIVQGQYFNKVSGSNIPDDVTGWKVVSDKRVAVFGGAQCTSLGNSTGACDHLEEQILPEEALASSYVASPTLSRPVGCSPTTPGSCSPDVFRYVATEAGTTVTTSPNVGGGFLTNPGDFIEITTATPHLVTADKPFYGYQYLISQDSGPPTAGTGDPAMLDMPPVDQFQFSYIFLTPSTYRFDFINLVAPVGTTLTLDTLPVTDTCTSIGTIGGVTYCFIVKLVADGVHTISGDKKFGLSVSGFDSFASYAYLGGVGLQPLNAGCDTGGPYQVLSCNIPSTVSLNGIPSCSDGTTPTVTWSSNNGVTFDNPATADPTATVPGFGTFNVTMTVQCGAAEPVQCTSTIQNDQQTDGCNQPPDAICQSVAVNTDPGICTVASASVDNGSFDPDPGDSITLVQSPAGPYGLGSTPVTLTATDTYDATDFCTASVNVNDGERPLISCPAPQQLECTGNSSADATVGAPTASDNCSVASATCSPSTGTFPLGSTAVSCSAADGSGNSSSCSSSVTVVDTTPPSISCPAPIVAECTGSGAATVTPGAATAGDICGAVTVSGVATGSYPLGSTTVTYTATDGVSLQNSCSATIKVVDTTNPTVSCVESYNPSTQNVPRADNINQDGFYRVGAGDSCTPPVIKLGGFVLAPGETIKITQTPGKAGVALVNTMGQANIRHFQVGPGDAVITATDGSGNSSSVTCLVPPPPR